MLFWRHQEAAQQATRRLALLFAVVVVLLVLAVNLLLALAYRLSFPMTHGYPAFFFETNTGLVLLFVLGGCAVEMLRLRDDVTPVVRMAGGRPAQVSGSAGADRLERRYANIVQEMALASRWPAPRAWVLPRDDAINAFAAGWRPDNMVIAVTRGALERLSREELQGVVAHEFSHLTHGDTRLNMQLIGLVWGLQMVFGFGQRLAALDEHGRRRAGVLFGWALMGVGALGWAAGRLLQAAMSRQREFLADASAVQFTRQVDGLGGALRKIAHQAQARRDRLLLQEAPGLAHLCLHAPGRAWLSGHPPIADRLRRLYGRPVESLPDDPLPMPADEPLAALASRATVAGARSRAASPATSGGTAAVDDASPAALRDDPLQRAELQAAADRERDALARIGRWHGVRQQRIALLALVAGRFDEAQGAAWLQQHRDLSFAAETWRELAVLSGEARLQALDLLATRFASAPVEDRQRLRHGLRALVDAPPATLRRLLVAQRLGRPQPFGGRATLDQRQAEALAATRALAAAFGDAPEAQGWLAAVATRLDAHEAMDKVARPQADATAPQPVRPLPANASAPRTARHLRRLSLMERPRLVRIWVDCAPAPLRAHEAFIEALTIACALLDTPRPAALQRPGAVQLRSL